MKKILSSIIILAFLASCSKSSTGNNNSTGAPTGTLTATIDGANMSFDTYPTAVHDTASGRLAVAFSGYNGSISGNRLQVQVQNQTTSIGKGTYYFDNPTFVYAYLIYSTVPGYVAFVPTGEIPDTCVVTITSIDSKSASGTFSGTVTDLSSDSHTITNGNFNLNFAD